MLNVDLEMVLHVLADTGKVAHHIDAERLQMLPVANAAELQQLRRVERSPATNDVLCLDRVGLATASIFDANGTGAVEQNLVGLGQRLKCEVRSVEHRVQVGTGCAEATASAHVLVEDGKTLLAEPVDVGGCRKPSLRPGF